MGIENDKHTPPGDIPSRINKLYHNNRAFRLVIDKRLDETGQLAVIPIASAAIVFSDSPAVRLLGGGLLFSVPFQMIGSAYVRSKIEQNPDDSH